MRIGINIVKKAFGIIFKWGDLMLSEEEITEIYNRYKAKYEELKGKSENDIGYVSERGEIKDIIELLEKILQSGEINV